MLLHLELPLPLHADELPRHPGEGFGLLDWLVLGSGSDVGTEDVADGVFDCRGGGIGVGDFEVVGFFAVAETSLVLDLSSVHAGQEGLAAAG